MNRVQVNDKGEMRIPAEVLEPVGIKPGDKVEISSENGAIIIKPHKQGTTEEPETPSKSYSEQLRGLHAEIWEGVDPDEYIRKERDAWEEE
jgi:AbrB family looped-hinge helix DNA binding protein